MMAAMGISRAMNETCGDMHRRRVIVVGAGVSGCACAAALSAGGISVTLLNPALDHVCEPSFGPELSDAGAAGERLSRVLESAPEGIREAWGEAMLTSADGSVGVLERRLTSVRTKQALENMEGVELRQGLVVGLEVSGGSLGSGLQGDAGDHGVAVADERSGVAPRAESATWGAKVQTVFGEEVEADAVVIGVGLGLGGSVAVGEEEIAAGQYGQPAAEGLEACLRVLGAEMSEVCVDVGPCYGTAGVDLGGAAMKRWEEASRRQASGSGWRFGTIEMERVGHGALRGSCEGPPSPYDKAELWTRRALVAGEDGDGPVAVILPDGVATGEVAIAPEWVGASVQAALARRDEDGIEGVTSGPGTITRPGQTVRGLIVSNVEKDGRLRGRGDELMPVWVTGRTAGTHDYLESLEAGLRTGEAVTRALGCGVPGGR